MNQPGGAGPGPGPDPVTDGRAAAGPAVPTAPPRTPGTRLVGIDAARGVAVLGMLVVNARIGADGDAVGVVWRAAHGRASLLFVLLAGIGVTLLTQGRSGRRAARMTLGWRALLLLPAGLLLDLLDHGAEVILPMYSALFALAVVLVALPSRWLIALAAASAALGPVTLLAVHGARGEVYEREAVSLGESAAEVLDRLVVSGAYPLVTWLAPFVLGIVIGRLDLRSARVQVRLVVAGAGTAVAALLLSSLLGRLVGPTDTGPAQLTIATAHSQMPLWLVSGTGAAVAVTGGLMLLGGRLPRLLGPLVATGQLALTVYVGHLVVLHLVPSPDLDIAGVTLSLGLLLVLGAVLGAVLWRTVASYGPLEAALRPPWAWADSVERR